MSQPSFFARHGHRIAIVVAFLLPFIWMGTRRALRDQRNDMKEWLPDQFEETADYRWFQENFPHDQFILASWEGCTLDDQRLELLAKKLVPEDPAAQDGGDQANSGAEVGPAGTRPAKSPSEAPRYFKAVLTGTRLVNGLKERYPGLSDEEIFQRLEGSLIGKDHLKTCLMVTLSDGIDSRDFKHAIDRIRELARQCNIEPPVEAHADNVVVRAWEGLIATVREMIFGREPPKGGIRLGGPPVDNVAINVEGQRTLIRLAGLSAIVGVVVSMSCFRSWRLTIMVFWTAILAAGISLATVFFTGATTDAIMLSMPSLVYVLAISGAVHIINYYHDAIREGGLDRAPERALGHAWVPCTLAAVTTAIGLGSLYRSHVLPISRFGVYSAVAVVATLGLLFLLLPTMLHHFPSRQFAARYGGKGHTKATQSVFARGWRRAGGVVIRHNLAVSLGCLLVMAFFFVGVFRTQPSFKLMKFFSSDAEIIHDYGWLEQHLGPLVPMEVVVTVDNAKNDLNMLDRMRIVKAVESTIEAKLPDVGGALSATTFGPELYPERRNPSVFERMVGLNRKRQRQIFDEKMNEILEGHREEFRGYLGIDGNPTLDELGIGGRLASRLKATRLGDLRAIEAYAGSGSTSAELAKIEGIDYQQAAEVEDAIRRWQAEHGTELWRITARVAALSDLDYADFVDELKETVEPVLAAYRAQGVEGLGVVYTGVVPLVYKTQHELMKGLVSSTDMAFVLIALVMMVVLKSPSAGLLSMVPNIFPVIVVFGVMGWTGIPVDIGSMMCASVALGVAVDDTMHYLTWFREALDRGLDRKEAALAAYERCGTAMSQTTLIGGLGLAVFAFSTFTPTQQFGIMMLVLLFAALFGDLIFLPSLLTGPLGRFFDRSGNQPKRPVSESSDSPTPQAPDREPPALAVKAPVTTPHLRHDTPHPSQR